MSKHDEIFGVDWGAVGRGALGAGHVAGKLLLNAFAGGAGVQQLEDLQQSKGILPDWASRAPTLDYASPDYVGVAFKDGRRESYKAPTRVVGHGGTLVPGNGYVTGDDLGKKFTVALENPTRVMVNDGKKEISLENVRMVFVHGGIDKAQPQPQGGIGSVVRVTGDIMSNDMNDDDINLAVTSVPDDAGTIDVFGDILGHADSPYWTEIAGSKKDDDYFVGCDILGAPLQQMLASGVSSPAARDRAAMSALAKQGALSSAARAGAQRPAPPPSRGLGARAGAGASKKIMHKVVYARLPNRVPAHKTVLTNAKKVAFNTKQAGVRLNARLKQIQNRATQVRGDVDILGGNGWNEILGAAVRPSAGKVPTTYRQKTAQRALERSRKNLENAIKRARPLGDKAIKKAQDLDAAAKKAEPIVAKLFSRPKALLTTRVRGDEVLGLDYGIPDPRFGDPGAGSLPPGADPTAPLPGGYQGAPGGGEGQGSYEVGPFQCVLPAEVELPQRGVPLSKEAALEVVRKVPPDAIPYQGERGLPEKSIGSYSFFYDKLTVQDVVAPFAGRITQESPYTDRFKIDVLQKYGSKNITPGFFWTTISTDGASASNGFRFQDAYPEDWWYQVVSDIVYKENYDRMNASIFKGAPTTIVQEGPVAGMQQFARNSQDRGWGPLIGNPNGPLAGLQYAIDDDTWFWQAQHAPAWAAAAADREIKRLSDEARKAAQSDCDTLDAERRMDQAQRDLDRARREYELSMSTSEEEVRSAVAANQLADQQVSFDQQQAQQQAELAMQAQRAELEWMQRQAALEQQAYQAALEYAQQQAPQYEQAYQDPWSGGDQFVNEGTFEGDTTDREAEEEALEQAESPIDLDYIPQSSDALEF